MLFLFFSNAFYSTMAFPYKMLNRIFKLFEVLYIVDSEFSHIGSQVTLEYTVPPKMSPIKIFKYHRLAPFHECVCSFKA